jgi:ribosomal protein S18 acetylase RimI-like enzyme
MEIIKITPSQGEMVFELFNKYRMFYKADSNIELATTYIQARLDNKESVIFVALDENKNPVGFTQLYPTFSSVRAMKNWILNDLYVEKDFRKQGVGEKLIRQAMEFAKGNCAKSLELSTGTDNFTAQNLYENIGFIRQSPDSDYFNYRITLD